MPDLLLFQLFGPLASWGEPAVGEYRPTATHPGKSQVVGLLAASLGVRRDEEAQLLALAEGYGVAVRIDAEGELLRDFHTIQVPVTGGKRVGFSSRREELSTEKTYTILSQRDYRVDAAWTCAIWPRSGAPHPLSRLGDALKRPNFVLYFGRKSCPPALPLNPLIVGADTLAGAFAQYRIDEKVAQHVVGSDGSRRFCWEEPLAPGLKSGFRVVEQLWQVPRHDVPRSRLRWQFARRDEFQAIV